MWFHYLVKLANLEVRVERLAQLVVGLQDRSGDRSVGVQGVAELWKTLVSRRYQDTLLMYLFHF